MKPSTRLFESFHGQGHYGVHAPGLRPEYQSYRSPHAPTYKVEPNFHGINVVKASRVGLGLGMFGAVAGVFAIFFFSDVPRVRIDIMQKIPIIGPRFRKEIPPEDNPF